MDSKAIITFSIIFIILFIGDLQFIVKPAILYMTGKKTKKRKKDKQLGELDYLSKKFKLNKNKINYKEIMYVIPLINSFIITLVTLIIDLLKIPFIFKMVICFILLLGLTYSLYEIYGRHLKKKEKED